MAKVLPIKTPIAKIGFSRYWQEGLCVIPENKGIPVFPWKKVYDESWKPTDDELLEWDLSDNDYGLVTGACSKVIAIDLDFVSELQKIKAIELLGDSPCAKFGEKGITLFYRYSGERNCTWIKDGEVKAELLSTGRKTTIPPSLHRKTDKPYIWVGESLLNCYKNLPALPDNYKESLDSLFSITRAAEKEYVRTDYGDMRPTYAEATKALSFCNANCSNDEWVQIGMAFKNEVGDAGFHDFDSWSQGGNTYDKHSIRSRWRSFNGHSITYGTLIYYAKQGGYQLPKQAEPIPTVSMKVEDWTAYKLETYAKQVKEAETLPDFYVNAPYHIKVICDWIVSTSRYPQPLITLGAVLSFLGFYMGKDFVYKGIKGNMYNINLARTGHGKEHILACIRGLMRELKLDDYIGGSGATSDTSIFTKLQKQKGMQIYLIDEFQGFMKVLSNKRSGNSREAGLTALLLKAYTSREIQSVDYADDKERPTIKIKNPYINLITFCTPEPFFDAVGSAEAFNGFVGRLTIFEAPKILPKRNKKHDPEADLNVPFDIINMLRDIKGNRERIVNSDGTHSYLDITQVKETKEAYELVEATNDEIDDKRREYDQESSQMSNVIARVFEIMKKYALIASRGKEITIAHITWAKALADYNVGIMLGAAENITDTEFERKKQHTIQYIIKAGGVISKSEFTSGCRVFQNRREREDVIQDLLDASRIEVGTFDTLTKSKIMYKFLK